MEDEDRAARFIWSPENGLPTITTPIQCGNCTHRHEGTIACDAFDRIPTNILSNLFDHTALPRRRWGEIRGTALTFAGRRYSLSGVSLSEGVPPVSYPVSRS